jgi:hypothetical protein
MSVSVRACAHVELLPRRRAARSRPGRCGRRLPGPRPGAVGLFAGAGYVDVHGVTKGLGQVEVLDPDRRYVAEGVRRYLGQPARLDKRARGVSLCVLLVLRHDRPVAVRTSHAAHNDVQAGSWRPAIPCRHHQARRDRAATARRLHRGAHADRLRTARRPGRQGLPSSTAARPEQRENGAAVGLRP